MSSPTTMIARPPAPRTRGRALALVLLTALGPGALAQVGDGDLPRDTFKGRWANHETAPISPLVFHGGELWTINQPGSRIVVFDAASGARLREIPAGPGLVSIAVRPGTQELWAVDRVTASVGVVDMPTGSLRRTIRVGAEPHGIAFTNVGGRAYVTCSAAGRVDVIAAGQYAVVESIPVPALTPRGIALFDGSVWITPFLSGNGTAPRGNPHTGFDQDVLDLRRVAEVPGANALPDRDLFRIPLAGAGGSHALDTGATVSGLGTVLYNLHRRPGTKQLWIPHTEALNADFIGEGSFPAGQVVRNRVAVVHTGTGARSWIDLDELTGTPELRCGTPAAVAFTPDGQRAFVAGYGSDTVAVLDLGGGTSLAGTIRVRPASNYPDGTGPRGLAVSPDGERLAIFNKGSNSLTLLALDALPAQAGFVHDAPLPLSLGWDPTPVDLVQGRIHFRRTRNSLSGTSSCDSCHVDGHHDGLAWDLSGFLDDEGTPKEQLAFPFDRKGPLVTQSVRSLKEVGPYHWRGERGKLTDFNDTFVTLLKRHESGAPKHLAGNILYVTQYMEHLTIPPNPRQAFDRAYTPEELEGADLFLNAPVENGLACVACHMLPLGTSGEITDNRGGGFAPATKVPSLRGVADELAPPFHVGGGFGTRTELGFGLEHAGAMPSLKALLLQELPPPFGGRRFDLSPAEADDLVAFLEAFDTGFAPAAAYQGTAHAGNVASFFQDELQPLLAQAQAGHCDVVYRFGPVEWGGTSVWMAGLYDPASGLFRRPSVSLPPISPAEVLHTAAGGTPVTFLGLPPLMGRAFALDRDNDDLLDLDELVAGTDPENGDTDGDDFPDGYEIAWGTNPLVKNNHVPDDQPPQLLGEVRVVWTTTSAVKLEFETDEMARALVSYDGGYPVLRWPLFPKHDRDFSIVVGELEAGRSYAFQVLLTDPEGNSTQIGFPVQTPPLALPAPVHVEELALTVMRSPGHVAEEWTLAARVRLAREGALQPGYSVFGSVYHLDAGGSPTAVVAAEVQSWLATPAGQVHFWVPVPDGIPRGAGRLMFVVQRVRAPLGAPPYAMALDELTAAEIAY